MNNIAIAAGHEKTAGTAREVLKAGGNAFDAAVAAMITSWVSEVIMSSPGGGGFANIVTAGKESMIVDFFCQTPKRKGIAEDLDFFPIKLDFKNLHETFHIGRGSIAVPGSVAGAFAIHQRYGTIPMRELVAPAIELAKNGFILDEFNAHLVGMVQDIVGQSPCAKKIFSKKDKQLQPGELFKIPVMVDFLETLAVEGKDLFYRGEIARTIADDQRRKGGNILMDDFADYEVILRKPVRMRYRDKTILTNPLPSLGGIVLLLIANAIQQLQNGHSFLSQTHFENIVEIFARVVAINKTPHNLASVFRSLQQTHPEAFAFGNLKKGGTTHLNVVDKLGNAVSMTMSNGEGSGYFVEGTGIHMNNMLGESALLPNGFHSWIPDTRLSSLMAPTIVTDRRGTPEIITGSGGAGRIPYAISQVLHNLLDHGVDVKTAVNAPRIHVLNEKIKYETGYNLKDFKHPYQMMEWSDASLYFGGVHTIQNIQGTYFAAGDFRRDGVGIVE